MKGLSGRAQDLLLTACRVAVAQATGGGLMVEVVVEMRSRGHVLGVVVVAHVRVINKPLPWFHQGAEAMGVAEGWRDLGAALLLRLRLVGS